MKPCPFMQCMLDCKKDSIIFAVIFIFIHLSYFRERLDALEKEIRIKSLQRSPGGHSHSHDSAIDSDMYEWETDHVDLDMVTINDTSFHLFTFILGIYTVNTG